MPAVTFPSDSKTNLVQKRITFCNKTIITLKIIDIICQLQISIGKRKYLFVENLYCIYLSDSF